MLNFDDTAQPDVNGEYLTSVEGDKKSCNCGSVLKDGCAHIEAVERFIKG
jgi:hypothetical protein